MSRRRSVPPAVVSSAARAAVAEDRFGRPPGGWRLALYRVIFESDTRAGRLFDLILIALIIASVVVVMLDSVQAVGVRYAVPFAAMEWFFTLLFSIEYLARLLCVQRPLRYATSFFGVVDFLSILPTYLAILFPEFHALIDIRVLRLLRIFRILKLVEYIAEYGFLGSALWASRRKIMVFLITVLMIVISLGTIMYVVEGPENGFTSVPVAIYWGITTMTTVGFGDITPKTDLGRAIASMMMLMGWGVLAVPTGIVTAEMTSMRIDERVRRRTCAACGAGGHQDHARYCQQCGATLQTTD